MITWKNQSGNWLIELNEKHKATENLEAIAEKIRIYLSTKDTKRENILRLCREIIRYSASAIRTIHRNKQVESEQLLDSASTLLRELNQDISVDHNDLLHSGFVHDAQKEFAEASITLGIIITRSIPSPAELEVSYPAYLNGLGEAIGELRRYILDSLRRDDFSRCEELLLTMDDIYDVLITMDFTDAITHGLRRTTDAARGILEKTRGDFTLTLRQKEFERKLEQITKKK